MLLFIAYVIKSCIEIFSCHYLGRCFLDVRTDSKAQFWLSNLLYSFITVGQVYFVRNDWITLFVSLFMTYILVNIYRGSRIKKYIITGAILVLGIAAEGFSLLILKIFLGLNEETIINQPFTFAVIIIFMGAIQLFLTVLSATIYMMYEKYKRNLHIIIALLIVALTFIISYMLVTFAQTKYLPAAIIVILLLIVSVLGCVGIFFEQLQTQQDRLRLDFLEQHVSNQVTHYSSIYNASMQVHILKHDLKNILINVQSYLHLQDYMNLQSYIETFQEKIQPSALVDTGNPLIDAVLTAKQSESNHITYQKNIDPLHLEYINPTDIAMLVATALDNAIEGCAECTNPYIRTEIHQNNNMVSIHLYNPTNHQLKQKENVLLTTKPNATEHGYGMLTIQHIAQKYQGDMMWDLTDNIFTLYVLLQDVSV